MRPHPTPPTRVSGHPRDADPRDLAAVVTRLLDEPGLWNRLRRRLPRAEDSLPTHDYLSVAVEFDNGQDLTYFWSAELAPETCFRCPLPNWDARETHLVVRSGSAGLGEWQLESRDLYADYERAIGAAPARIVAVWLIAVSVFQKRPGSGEFSGIALEGEGRSVTVL